MTNHFKCIKYMLSPAMSFTRWWEKVLMTMIYMKSKPHVNPVFFNIFIVLYAKMLLINRSYIINCILYFPQLRPYLFQRE